MKRILSLLTAAVFSLSLAACKPDKEEKTEISVNVRNITGVAISELYIFPESFNNYGSNRITENLKDNSTISVNLGSYTDDEVSGGYALQATSAEDGTYESFANLMLKNNDTVTFYMDALGLAVAVNTSDEDIKEMIDELAEDMKNYTEPSTEAES